MDRTLLRTPAIALRLSAFSRTSRMVTWLTPGYGRLVTAIKGACRPRSAFLGQYDLAGRCELLFYRREREGVHVARECAPLSCRPHLRRDWRAAVAAGYICDLAGRVAQPMLAARALFALLDETLDRLTGGAALEAQVLWFELRLLDCLGLAPRLAECPGCPLAPEARDCRFALAAGRLGCRHRPAPQPSGAATVALDAALLDTLRRWQRAAAPPGGDNIPAANLTVGMRRFLDMFMRCHLDVPAAPRQALFAWLAAMPGGKGESVARNR